uniref:Protein FAR1-RELATED SEQUENCE n=1 Tax=Lactuca sativa TaxID=4236 RepID=A0A9R1W947_LACSA|nr:hypothetical protein LSAT_V11C300146000 [Lactuca sativa]
MEEKRSKKLVWDMPMKLDVFEVKWDLLMKDFKLEESIRFKYMFTKCCSWIPGYFSDIPMCDLLKTTSRPEILLKMGEKFTKCSEFKSKFKVGIKVKEMQIKCSCEHFSHIGVLCRHAFTIMMRCDVKEILEFESDSTFSGFKNKTDVQVVSKLIGASILKEINIHVPQVQSNKGYIVIFIYE